MAESSPSILRHPLAAVIVGFLLTGVAGAFLSDYLTTERAMQERAAEIRETRKNAIQDFARLVYERRTRAELLVSAIRREAEPGEVRERKTRYDEAYAAWGSELQANLFLIRSVVDAPGYSAFEGHVEFRLVPLLRELDRCVTRAYDATIRGRDGAAVLAACESTALLQATLDCGYAITDQLFRLAEVTGAASREAADSLFLRADRAVVRSCGGERGRP